MLIMKGFSREVVGTNKVKVLRRKLHIPAIINYKNAQNAMISIEYLGLESILKKSQSNDYEIEIDKQTTLKVKLKEVQRHPISQAILHLDFQICTNGSSV